MNANNRLREIRKERNISGVRVAEILNITPQYYYEIERGKKRLSAEMATKLANFFNVSLDYLLGRTDDPNSESTSATINRSNNLPSLTPKEELDIARDLEKMISNLESNEALAFNGEPLDEQSRELLRISLENSMRLAKQLAKQKFNPRKRKK
jgi:transcriptional regulator with XRE-family HTH domain